MATTCDEGQRRLEHPARRAACIALLVVAAVLPARAVEPPSSTALLAAQRDAMKPLAAFDGRWRGTATIHRREGDLHLIHTERVGTMLDGTVRLFAGRSYADDGTPAFDALGVVSYDPDAKTYVFKSYAQGRAGDFPMDVDAGSYDWGFETPGGAVRFTAKLADGTWTEVGTFTAPGRPPVRTFEMSLTRIGDGDWPEAGAVAPR